MNAAKRQKQLRAEAEDLENARFIHRADIVIMTESTDDEPFWKTVFRQSLPDKKVMFNYAVQPEDRGTYGKTKCLKYATCTTPHFVLAIDSDFDRFLDTTFPPAQYIFHTITYSWENHYCWIPALDDWYKGTEGRKLFSFTNFLTSLSSLLHPYLMKLLTAKKLKLKDWTLDDMCRSILSIQPNKKEYQDNDGEKLINAISQELKQWATSLTVVSEDEVKKTEKQAHSKGESYSNSYLFMQGHCIYDTICRLGAALTGLTSTQFEDKVLRQNLTFGRYTEINALTAEIRKQLQKK